MMKSIEHEKEGRREKGEGEENEKEKEKYRFVLLAACVGIPSVPVLVLRRTLPVRHRRRRRGTAGEEDDGGGIKRVCGRGRAQKLNFMPLSILEAFVWD